MTPWRDLIGSETRMPFTTWPSRRLLQWWRWETVTEPAAVPFTARRLDEKNDFWTPVSLSLTQALLSFSIIDLDCDFQRLLCVFSWRTSVCRSAAPRKARSISVPSEARVWSSVKEVRLTDAAVWRTGRVTLFFTHSMDRSVRVCGCDLAWCSLKRQEIKT